MQSSKNISFILKLFIVVFAFYFVYQKVFANENLNEMYSWFLNTIQYQSPQPLILVLLLMFVNWILDAVKWRYLISKIETVSLWLSIKAVFLGITVSIFTPNRVGEFGGRVFCLETCDRIKAVIITILGNIAQLLVTLIFGGFAFLNYIYRYVDFLQNKDDYFYFILVIIVLILLSILIIFYLNTSALSRIFSRFSRLRRFQDYIDVFSFFNRKELSYVIALSALRYAVFSFQYFILLDFFNVEITILESLTMSSLLFLSISIIPTIAITEIGIRGSLAIYFFGLISVNSIGILTATFALWMTNLVLPALLGTILVYNLKFFRQ